MLRKTLLALATLLAADVATTAASPLLGASLTAEAQAADFTGRIKRIKIKKRRVGSGFKITVRADDGGDGTVNTVAKVALSISDDGSVLGDSAVSTTISSPSDSRVFRSSLFSFDDASPPEGEYLVLTDILDSSGEPLGVQQEWLITAEGTENTIEAQGKVDSSVYISELEMTADECGNARFKAVAEGDDAEKAAGVDLIFEEPFEGPAPLETELSASLKRAKAGFTSSDVDLGEAWAKVAALEEHAVVITVTAYDEKGNTIGTTKAEATAKYGDILIDGVPLEFD